ncbi:MAG: hypothetical protein ACOYM7_11080, partial [Paludibacter sp.]
CKQTKQVLAARGISYIEKDVSAKSNASEMLSNLALSGFKSSIYMPVIYVAKKLKHPAYATQTELIDIEINAVVDSLTKQNRRGEIAHFIIPSLSSNLNASESISSDCEHTSGAVYLIAAKYPNEKEAVSAVQTLIKYAYPNAGFVLNNSAYCVYLNLYPNFETASTQLSIEKFKFTDAFLLQVK